MIPDSLDFITRGTDEQQAEYAAAAHKTTVPAAEGEANAGAVKSSASPSLPRKGGADTNSSNADAVGAPASDEAPQWGPVSKSVGALLNFLAANVEEGEDFEWRYFVSVLWTCANEATGEIDQNDVRPLLHGAIKAQRIGALYRRACREGLIRPAGYTVTDNSESGNVGRPAKSYAWLGT